MQQLEFSLTPIPPFRLDLTAWVLRRRSINGIDDFDGEVYSRVLAIKGTAVLVQVVQSGAPGAARLQIRAMADRLPHDRKAEIKNALQRLLGLQIDMRPFYRFARQDSKFRELSQRFIGLKPPRFPSVFEAIVNGIACQQLSLHVGLLLLNRLAGKTGLAFQTAKTLRFAFPEPENLQKVPIRTFRQLGFSTNKAIALKSVSGEIREGMFDPENLAGGSNEQALARLLQLRGVGRWTAQYVLLRGLGRVNVFPGDDVGARNSLRRWLKLERTLDYNSVTGLLSRWRPYSGLLYFHLLADSLQSTAEL